MASSRFPRAAVGVCVATMLADPWECDAADLERIARALTRNCFHGVTIWPQHVEDAGIGATRKLLDDAGITVRVVEGLVPWQEGAGAVGDDSARLLAAASELGADLVLAASRHATLDIGAASEGLAALCDRAAPHGLRVTIEFVPGRSIGDLATAWDVVRASGAPNAGLVIDFVHMHNQPGGLNTELLAQIPGRHLPYVQVSDRLPQPSQAARPGAPTPRCMPREGIVDIDMILRALDPTDADPFVAFEVFSASELERGVDTMAARMQATAGDLFN